MFHLVACYIDTNLKGRTVLSFPARIWKKTSQVASWCREFVVSTRAAIHTNLQIPTSKALHANPLKTNKQNPFPCVPLFQVLYLFLEAFCFFVLLLKTDRREKKQLVQTATNFPSRFFFNTTTVKNMQTLSS